MTGILCEKWIELVKSRAISKHLSYFLLPSNALDFKMHRGRIDFAFNNGRRNKSSHITNMIWKKIAKIYPMNKKACYIHKDTVHLSHSNSPCWGQNICVGCENRRRYRARIHQGRPVVLFFVRT